MDIADGKYLLLRFSSAVYASRAFGNIDMCSMGFPMDKERKMSAYSDRKFTKRKRRQRFKEKRREHLSPDKRKFGRIIPKVKFCKRCQKNRVKHHHYYCQECWLIIKKEKDPNGNQVEEF